MFRPSLLVTVPKSFKLQSWEPFWKLLPVETKSSHKIETLEYELITELFEYLKNKPVSELRDLMVVLHIEPSDSSPWDLKQLGRASRGIAGELFMAYPEIYFVFVGCETPVFYDTQIPLQIKKNQILEHHFVGWTEILKLCHLLRIHSSGFRPLFDPTGFRNVLKYLLLESSGISQNRGIMYKEDIKRRFERTAVTADEESHFTYLNAYSAYKAGFSTWMLPTYAEFRRILPDKEESRSEELKKFDLILSDLDLAYADYESDEVSSNELLVKNTCILSDEPLIIISHYASHIGKTELFQHQKKKKMLGKPYLGCEHLIKEIVALLIEVNRHENKETKLTITVRIKNLINRAGELAAKFIGPLPGGELLLSIRPKNTVRDKRLISSRHHLPYARSRIITTLLERAALYQQAAPRSVESMLCQALVSLEAKELLGEISRMTAYNAFWLQVEGEVSAEVSWFVTTHEAEIETRLTQIENETSVMVNSDKEQNYDISDSEKSRINFLAKITDKLRQLYSDNEQVEAAQFCLRKLADYRTKLLRSNFSKWLWWYISKISGDGTSVARLMGANILLVLFFTASYFILLMLNQFNYLDLYNYIFLAASHSLFILLELQPGLSSYEENFRSGSSLLIVYYFIFAVQLVLSYLHLGLFISILYRRLTRHAP